MMKILTVSDRVEPVLYDHFQAESFRDLIDRYAPRYFIHGHMHFNYTDRTRRMTSVNNTKVINSYGYYIFEIDLSQHPE